MICRNGKRIKQKLVCTTDPGITLAGMLTIERLERQNNFKLFRARNLKLNMIAKTID